MGKYSEFSTGNTSAISDQSGYTAPIINEYTTEETNAVALDILKSKEFADVARRYYSTTYSMSTMTGKDPSTMTQDELIRTFYEDRVYANNNTIGISADLKHAMSATEQEKNDFAYLSNLYANLPSFWNDENRSFGQWVYDYGGALLLDPVNVVGFGVGGQAAKVAYKKASTEALKGLVKKEISKEVFETIAQEASKEGLQQAVISGAVKTGALNAVIAGAHDTIIQNTESEVGISDGYSLKRGAVSTAFGFGLGTVFGGVFSGVGFTRKLSKLKGRSREILENQHLYGKDIDGKAIIQANGKKAPKTLTGNQLARAIEADIDDKLNLEAVKNGKRDVDSIIEILEEPFHIAARGKPPKTKFNTEEGVIKRESTARIIADDAQRLDDLDTISNDDLINIADQWALRADKVEEAFKSIRKFGGEEGELLIKQVLTGFRHTVMQYEKMYKLSRELNDSLLPEADKLKLIEEINAIHNSAVQNLADVKAARGRAGQLLQSMGIAGDSAGFKSIVDVNSPDFAMNLKKIEGNSREFWESFGKLEDPAQRASALENAMKYEKWDIANQFINNNLLSSPDTTFLNVLSGLANSQWKPMVMILRSGRLYANKATRDRAYETFQEGYKTYLYQISYTLDALRAARKSLYRGNPILDPRQTKFDSQVRQGALEKWVEAWGRTLGGELGAKVAKPIGVTLGMPMRIVGASDEFLKTMMFKGRAAAAIDVQIKKQNPEIYTNRAEYHKKFNEEMARYIDENGRATSQYTLKGRGDSTNINDPLQYAREGSYTQSLEGQGAGAAILAFAERNKWARALGLHFISTPTNLLRWNFQHFPFLGRYQFQMKRMLAKNNDKSSPDFGKYLNPEAAAEAKARMDAGLLLWGSAFAVASMGVITGGGSQDPIVRQEKEKLGWQPYSIKVGDRYISFNRLDPIFLPFGIMADLFQYTDEVKQTGNDMPRDKANLMTEISVAALVSLTRNMTSKFYTKSVLDLANTFLDGGFAYSNNPEKKAATIGGQFANKINPLSGLIRYVKRVTDKEQRELRTMTDKLIDTSPFHWQRSGLMPKRNVFGEIVRQKRGWLFGIGGKDGLWSSPFAMTNFESDEVTRIIRDMDIDYTPPSRKDNITKMNLDEIRYENQTAYDFWMMKTGEEVINGKTLKQSIESIILNPKDPLFAFLKRLPKENVYDERKLAIQTYIIQQIRIYQDYTLKKYLQRPKEFGQPVRFPQLVDEIKKQFDTKLLYYNRL